ncbi:MAG TPA: hypothetical protein VIP51_06825 [Eoetvoesiella sp.]
MTTTIAQGEHVELDNETYFGARRALSLVWAAHKILVQVPEGPRLSHEAMVEMSERVGHLMELAEIEIEAITASDG